MTKEDIFGLLSQLKRGFKNRRIRLDILGKEPLLREDLFEIIRYAKQAARIGAVELFTNGTLIDISTAYKLKQAGVDVAMVTLYSHDKLMHDQITQVSGSWDKTVAGIKALCVAGIRTYSMTVLMDHNAGSLEKIKSFVKTLGARAAYFPYMQQQKDDLLCIKDPERFQEAVDWVFKSSLLHKNYVLEYAHYRGKICPAFVGSINIQADGTVTPCPFIDVALGNIKNEKFYTILHNVHSHKKLMDFLSTPEECKTCSILSLCRGGCKASHYGLSGNLKSRDIHCRGPYTQAVPKEALGEYMPCIY